MKEGWGDGQKRLSLWGLPAGRAEEGPDRTEPPSRCIAASRGARVARLRCPIPRAGTKTVPEPSGHVKTRVPHDDIEEFGVARTSLVAEGEESHE